jgi:hypothetical protein
MKKLLPTRRSRLLAAVIAALVLVIAIVLALVLWPRTYSLSKTPETTRIPAFSSNADAVSGWRKVVGDDPAASAIPLQVYKNKASTCALQTTAVVYPSYFSGRGDFYLSKYALYDQATQKGQLIKGEGVASISVKQGGSLQFVTGHEQTSSPTQRTWVAVRAIDKLYKLPAAALGNGDASLGGSDKTKGVPMLTVQYICNGKAGSQQEFDTLLKALHVDLR